MAKSISMGNLIQVFLLSIVALALTPTIQESVTAVTGTGAGNLTGPALALMTIYPLFWVILIIIIPVVIIASKLGAKT